MDDKVERMLHDRFEITSRTAYAVHADAGHSLRLPLLPLSTPGSFFLENVDRSWSFGPILEITFWTPPKSGGVCMSQMK